MTCPVGSYCFDGNALKTCDKGHYCAGSNKKKPCFPGKYGTTTGQSTEASACASCPAGKACELFGTTTNYKTCKGGYYCQTGSISNIPQTAPQGGARCQMNSYCPEGSSAETTCTAGKYCDRHGLSEPTGNCEAGYYCLGSTTKQNPRGTQGNICPAGHYCPEGSSAAIKCPIGTYRDYEGGEQLSDCYDCPHGYYCQTEGQVSPTTYVCAAGYYCDEGEITGTPTSTICPAGSQCPAGSKIPIKCELGTYQGSQGQSSCATCPAGFYCGPSSSGIDGGISIPTDCPAGYYCESGTKYGTQYPCPDGTYSAATGLTASGS